MLKSYELFQADEKRCIFVAYQFPIISLCWMRFATFKFRPCAAGTARILESIWPLPLILPLINQNNAFTVDVFCLNNAKAIPYLACTLHPARDFAPSLRECQSQEYFRFSLFSSVVRCLTLTTITNHQWTRYMVVTSHGGEPVFQDSLCLNVQCMFSNPRWLDKLNHWSFKQIQGMNLPQAATKDTPIEHISH